MSEINHSSYMDINEVLKNGKIRECTINLDNVEKIYENESTGYLVLNHVSGNVTQAIKSEE